MSSRELIILILGLAIVAVVLRGLFVALRARKGQIRLSIAKNIPGDIDLEALELAELPSGGARVVARSLESVINQNSRLDAALQRAEELQLGTAAEQDGDVPILMDAVSLSNPSRSKNSHQVVDTRAAMKPDFSLDDADYNDDTWLEPGHSSEVGSAVDEQPIDSEPDFAEVELDPQLGDLEENDFDSKDIGSADTNSKDADSDDIDDETWENQSNKEDESPDDVLLDYEDYSDDDDEIGDSLASLAPDYRSDSDIEAAPSVESEPAEGVDEVAAGEDYEDDSFADEELINEEVINEEVGDEIDDDDEQPHGASIAAQAKSFEDQLDDFSLSAGERIGFNESQKTIPPAPAKPKTESLVQSSLFDDEPSFEEIEAEKPKPEKSKPLSFFSALKRSMTPQEKPQEKSQEKSQEKLKATEPVASTASKVAADDEIVAEAWNLPTEPPLKPQSSTERPSKDSKNQPVKESRAQSEYTAEASSQPSEVLVINIMAKAGYGFAGDDLLRVLITAGLKFGEMNIFHQRIGADKKGPVLFSVANVLNPGTFDLNNMDDFTTLGVSFFLALPTVMNNLEAFEKMLAVAQQVKSGLNGEMKDDNRNVMTSQTVEHYRQRVRDFELRRLKAAGVRH